MLFFINFIIVQYTDSIPDDLLKRVNIEYEKRNYVQVIEMLEDTIEHFDRRQKSTAYLYIGLGYSVLGFSGLATESFKKLLKINPAFKLDPAMAAPLVVYQFNAAKKEIASESAVCSCFIPGTGQMLKGEDRKGKIIMSGAAASFVFSVYSWTITDDKHNQYLSLGPGDTTKMDEYYNVYNRWYKISVTSSCVFGLIYIYSFLDAMMLNNKIGLTTDSKYRFWFDGNYFRLGYTIKFE